MRYIHVIDESLKNTLLSQKYKIVKEQKDINNKTIWVFEDTSSRFCFDIQNDSSLKSKCFVTDRLTMTF